MADKGSSSNSNGYTYTGSGTNTQVRRLLNGAATSLSDFASMNRATITAAARVTTEGADITIPTRTPCPFFRGSHS